ncbi:hypothetical protein IB276_22475 [Ensifer sp. ENS04]|uniref:hypothetical protein n=1 Tax=Ensifer sp. ENS04 TaxID=2769281 RepID=UPI00177E0A60|nr:hypothetical protein [Ensifer sp. ENS04]MBD9542214.1 hypothetical protein [Ensifer sp. ENS04]
MGGLLSVLGALAVPFKLIVTEVSKWSERRDLLQEASLKAQLAKIAAETDLAAYKAKADVEWDLAWAGQAQASWKDEYVLLLWTVPMLAFIPTLFFPSLRDEALTTLQFLQNTFGPDLLYWYMGGWGVIFSATFGLKGALQFMVPGNAAKIASTLSTMADDIPDSAVEATTERIKKLVSEGKQGLF